jgi:hypothetical protein
VPGAPPYQCGLHIIISSASPLVQLVTSWLSKRRPLGPGPIKPSYQLGQMCGFVSSRPSATPEYHLPDHHLQIRKYLLDVFLSCIPGKLLSDVRPRGGPST